MQKQQKQQSFNGIKDRKTGKVVYVYSPDENNPDTFLGKGEFGKVFKGMAFDQDTQQLGEEVAIKKIYLPKTDELSKEELEGVQKSIQSEIDIFKKINDMLSSCKYLISVKGIYHTPKNVYVIMEYCKDGNLQQCMEKNKKFSEKNSLIIINSVINGVKNLVDYGIWHRDVKPSNIMRQKNLFKICDYGFTKIVQCNPASQGSFTNVGTPYYCCPQILNDQKYSSKCDVFSIGVILFQLLFGFDQLPWGQCSNFQQLADRVIKQSYEIPKTAKVSKEMLGLLNILLAVEEENRPLASEILELPLYQKLLSMHGISK